jgi:hypothetical protein
MLNIRQKLQYAKDFKDIWWVGERADGVIVAIKLIRSLSDSGFSLQTNKSKKGQISVTLKGHSSFSDIKKVPMEIYVLAENDSPEIPTASLYLYGRPSETGNIGLRNGESVTLYDGAVLPPLPELSEADKETYPCWYVTKRTVYDVDYGLQTVYDAFAKKYSIKVNDTAGNITTQSVFAKFYRFCPYLEHKWFETSSASGSVIWANTPVYYADDVEEVGGTVYLSSPDPIPVTGIVGYSYNGTVLPELPEWDKTVYPYAYIQMWDTGTQLVLLADYEMVINDAGKWAIKPVNGHVTYNYSTSDSEWFKPFIPGGLPVPRVEFIKWANFDILNEDGSVYLSASAPIPVYE